MRAISGGGGVLAASKHDLDIPALFDSRNQGSVIRSRLAGLKPRGFEEHGDDLGKLRPYVDDAGWSGGCDTR